MKEKFGVSIVKKSFQEFGQAAKEISDAEAAKVLKDWQIPTEGVSERMLNSAVKIYIAVKHELENDGTIGAVGINCLNESRFSDTTPCLAWNMLYEERKLIWGCEGDTLVMLTEYLLHKSLDVPIMMTNLYPFLMGQAALKHERIPHFPEVESEPENHLLLAHCGYLGVVPQSFSTDWKLVPKALAIVDDNAIALDARMAIGNMTLAKLDSTLSNIMVIEGELKDYVQYPDSDCRNGAVIKVSDGRKLMNSLYSHHYCLMTGHNGNDIDMLSKVFNLNVERI
jgi:L-fucose isomerase-like protein